MADQPLTETPASPIWSDRETGDIGPALQNVLDRAAESAAYHSHAALVARVDAEGRDAMVVRYADGKNRGGNAK